MDIKRCRGRGFCVLGLFYHLPTSTCQQQTSKRSLKSKYTHSFTTIDVKYLFWNQETLAWLWAFTAKLTQQMIILNLFISTRDNYKLVRNTRHRLSNNGWSGLQQYFDFYNYRLCCHTATSVVTMLIACQVNSYRLYGKTVSVPQNMP